MRYSDFQGQPNPKAPHEGPLVVTNAVTTLRALLAGGALQDDTLFVIVTVEAQPLRLTVNGTAPTATLGFNCLADSERLLSREEADNCKLIRAGGTDSTIQVAQYRG